MAKKNIQEPSSKGLLYQKASTGKFDISRHLPSEDLAMFVQHYWIARWDLRGKEPYVTETLPYPGVNLVFENDGARIWGVFSSKSEKRLEGQGRACSILFRPGGFYPFYNSPLSALTDSSETLARVFGSSGRDVEMDLLLNDDDPTMIRLVEALLRSKKPKADNHIVLINKIIETVIDDRSITKVHDVCSMFGLSERTMQDLFSTYVGIGLKWVIMRYRMQDAVTRISNGIDIDWATLALDLGYVDQPHFINDFRKIIGKSPNDYARIEQALT
jgi:AraC-like DNA-binding protein